jgi:hypothetical protein
MKMSNKSIEILFYIDGKCERELIIESPKDSDGIDNAIKALCTFLDYKMPEAEAPKLQLNLDALAFGKHAGSTINTVFEEDPSYIIWLYESVDEGKRPHIPESIYKAALLKTPLSNKEYDLGNWRKAVDYGTD